MEIICQRLRTGPHGQQLLCCTSCLSSLVETFASVFYLYTKHVELPDAAFYKDYIPSNSFHSRLTVEMSQIHLILGGAILFTFGLRVLTMPMEEDSLEEIALEYDSSSFTNSSEGYTFVPECYLQKNESGIIMIVNMTRAEVGNDTYLGYEEICPQPPALSISIGALGSLAGK